MQIGILVALMDFNECEQRGKRKRTADLVHAMMWRKSSSMHEAGMEFD